MVRVLCARLCEHGGYPEVDPALVADGLSALTDGLWLDLLVRPESMTRELARRISLDLPGGCLSEAFPAAGADRTEIDGLADSTR